MDFLSAGIGALGSVAGGIVNNLMGKNAADEAYENQKNIIQHQTSWLVKDAKRNGIHPLAVLGMNPASGPPPAQVFDSGLGEAGAALGAAASRAMSPEAKMAARSAQLALERQALDNDFIRSQTASQRMRNIQQSTPGVKSTTGNDVLVNPFTGDGFGVKHSMLGQDAENAYGEFGSALFGTGNLIADSIRNNGGNPENFWRDPVGASARPIGDAVLLGIIHGLERDLGVKLDNDSLRSMFSSAGSNPYADSMPW